MGEQRIKANYIGAPAVFALEEACRAINDAAEAAELRAKLDRAESYMSEQTLLFDPLPKTETK